MEAMIWRQLRHRNILTFYGVCIDEFSPQLALVSPWMINGDVLSYTKKYPTVNRINIVNTLNFRKNLCTKQDLIDFRNRIWDSLSP